MTKRPLVLVGLTVFACALVALPAGSQDASPFTTEQEQRVRSSSAPISSTNPDGAVSVVEFFDYNCPYCRRSSPIVAEMLKANPDVQLVYQEWAILGEPSEFAARAALATHRQSPELYESFRAALMAVKNKLTDDAVVEIARDVSIDVGRMRSDMDDPAIAAHIARMSS